jgi:hypothetical protein
VIALQEKPLSSVNRRPTFAAVPAADVSAVALSAKAEPVFTAFTASTTSATFAAWLYPVTEAETSSGTAALYGIICGNNPVNFRDPSGLLYDWLSGVGTSGASRGGFLGGLQMNLAAAGTALLDTIGGRAVETTSALSGAASGRGENLKAVGWGATSAGLIALNAVTFMAPKGAILNAGQWAKNPLLYEVGSMTIPKAAYESVALLGPVARGRVLLDVLGWSGVGKLSSMARWSDWAVTLAKGPTTGGLLGVLGIDQLWGWIGQELDPYNDNPCP